MIKRDRKGDFYLKFILNLFYTEAWGRKSLPTKWCLDITTVILYTQVLLAVEKQLMQCQVGKTQGLTSVLTLFMENRGRAMPTGTSYMLSSSTLLNALTTGAAEAKC